jgi:hypothetical protein
MPILLELHSIGLNIENIGELITKRDRYEAAIPILLHHLILPYSDEILETIGRALAVPEPKVREAWPILLNEYRKNPDGRIIDVDSDQRTSRRGAKDGLACALAVAVTKDTLNDLIELAMDHHNGVSRIFLLSALKRSKDERAKRAIDVLAADPQLAIEIASWRKK